MSDPRVSNEVVGVAFAAFMSEKLAHPVQAMRSALEAAVPLLAPQPVDREALETLLEQCGVGHDALIPSLYRQEVAAKVLALLNGSATPDDEQPRMTAENYYCPPVSIDGED